MTPRATSIVIALLCAGCGQIIFDAVTTLDSSSDTDSSTTTDSSTDTDSSSDSDDNWFAQLPEAKTACAFLPTTPGSTLPPLVVGDGTPQSCTEAALRFQFEDASNRKLGRITFNCGPDPVTIPLTAPLTALSTAIIEMDGGGLITLDGQASTPVIIAEYEVGLYLHGLRFVNGLNSGTFGGAISIPDGGSNGLSRLIVENCLFSNNQTPGQRGGAIYAQVVDTVEIFRSRFENNSAGNGGAIYILGDAMRFADIDFITNSAEVDGGAVFVDGVDNNVTEDFDGCGLLFQGNQAQKHGSAMKTFMYGNKTAVLRESEFVENETLSAMESYGAFYHAVSPLSIENTTFRGNSSASSAGAVYLDRTSGANITNCTFYDNRANGAESHGGAIFVPTGSSAQIVNCTFSQNAAAWGPALDTPPPPSDTGLYNSIFADNVNTGADPDRGDSCTNVLNGADNIQFLSSGAVPPVLCTADVQIADPMLGTPANNGGNVSSIAIVSAGSAAIDRADQFCPPKDTRGESRTDPCDAGSFEF